MPKRRTHDSDNRYDVDDNPIGLTSAFAPVKGPQSVDYDEAVDDPVGLTGAFGAIPAQDEPRAWDEASKWKDFDWDAALGEPVGHYGEEDEEQLEEQQSQAEPQGDSQGDSQGEPEQNDADVKGDEPEHREVSTDAADQPAVAAPAATAVAKPASSSTKSGPKHGRHAAAAPELSPRMKKSKRTRTVLIVLVIVLIIAIAGLGFFMYRMFSNSQQEAAQQTQEQIATARHDVGDANGNDAPETSAKLADVPNLTKLLGLSQDDAISTIGHGALVTANHAVEEEGNPIKTNLNVALTEESADTKTGTPTVYLGLGEDGAVRQAGYSASASALGFGSLSFADAVNNEHVIEKTLAKVGVNVPEGSATLPENKDEYSTYASDGTTVVRERCSFEGDVDVNGVPCTWSAVLSYDYTTQVVTGNLSDTVRIIYVYITMK